VSQFIDTVSNISYPDSGLDILGNQISLYGWVWKTSTSATPNVMIRGNGTGNQFMFQWTNPGDNDMYFGFWTAGAFALILRTFALTDITAFHHLAISYNGVLCKLYVDGIERHSVAETRSIQAPAGGSFTVKSNSAGASSRFAHIGVHNVGLSAYEIQEAMRYGSTRRGLKGYWPLRTFGPRSPDLSGYGNYSIPTGGFSTLAVDPPVIDRRRTPLIVPAAAAAGGGARSQGIIIY